MNSKLFYSTITLLVSFVHYGSTFPFGLQPSDQNAPKNPFARSHVPFQGSTQQDLPLAPSNQVQQQSQFLQGPRLLDPAESPNAADWPTPPPIGGGESPAQQASFSNSNPNPPSANSLSVPPSLSGTNNNPIVRPNPNQQAFDLVTPPPIPQSGSQQVDWKQNSLPKTPGEAHLWAKQQQANQARAINAGNGSPFDNLPIQNTVKPQFQMAPQSNPFDSLPIRNRQRRQFMGAPPDAPVPNPAVPNPAIPNPAIPNPALPNPAAPNGIPNVPSNPAPAMPNGMPNMPTNPNPAMPNVPSNPAMPNPAVPKTIPQAIPNPDTPNPNNIPQPAMPNPNPAVPNPSNIPQPAMPNPNPAMPNPAIPNPSQANPNGFPPKLLNNPGLPKAPVNPKYPPLSNPTPPKSKPVSGFPNTNGNVVLGRDPSLPDVKEQKIFLPSQLANQQNLVRDQKTPLKETKPLLPSQLASIKNFGNIKR